MSFWFKSNPKSLVPNIFLKIFFCSLEERNSYSFVMPRGREYDDDHFYFGVNYPLKQRKCSDSYSKSVIKTFQYDSSLPVWFFKTKLMWMLHVFSEFIHTQFSELIQASSAVLWGKHPLSKSGHEWEYANSLIYGCFFNYRHFWSFRSK